MTVFIRFLRFWVWFSFRHLRMHYWRALGVLLGIGLGAAVFTSVRLAVNASVDSFTRSVELIAGQSDWTVIYPGGGVPEHLVEELFKHPAVQAASPLMTTYVRPVGSKNEVVLLIGLDPILDRSLRSWDIERQNPDLSPASGLDLIKEPYTLLAGPKFLEKFPLSDGHRLTLEHVQNQAEFRVLGSLSAQGLGSVESGLVALTDVATFQEFTGSFGTVDRIDLLLKPSVTPEDVQSIRSILPQGVLLERPSESKESGIFLIRSYQLNLSVLSFVSLFVGMFLVYSLVSLHATSRRHELSVVRSLGISSRMLFGIFLADGAFLGLMGWLVAIPLSSFMVRHLLERVSSTITHLYVRVQVDRLALDPWEILLSFAVTMLIALTAAAEPALEAARVSPKEVLLKVERSVQARSTYKPALLGLCLVLLVWPLSRLPNPSIIPLPGYIATFTLFCGFSLTSPACLRLMGRYLPSPLYRLGGEPAYLAGRYLRSAGTRIAISVGALITAIALFTALVIMVHSFRSTVELWANQSISGDLFIRPKMSEINQYRDPIPRDVVSELKRLESVDALPYRRIFVRYGNVPYQFEAIDFEVFSRYSQFLFIEGDPKVIFPPLIRGEGVLVSEVFANLTGLRVGSTYRAHIEGVNLERPVLGIFRDYRTQGGVVHYALPRFAELSGDDAWSGARLFFNDPHQASEAKAMELRNRLLLSFGQQASPIEITTGVELRRAILEIFDETFRVTTALLLIALFVAGLGITTTLTVLVLERTRQLHTLLACGAGPGQIRAMIFWEASLIILPGEILGLGCGFLLSYLLVFVINKQSFGWTFLYSVDWTSLLMSLPLIILTALAAALPAAQMVFSRSTALVLRE